MDYPTNSKKSKQAPSMEPKKIEKVVTGEVIRRKPSIGKRLAEVFVGGDAQSVWAYVAYDVLIPAAKDMISDAFSTGIDRMLFGDSSRSSRSRGRGSTPNYVSYDRYASKGSKGGRDREEQRSMSRRGRASHNFDELILATRAEAEEVIERMYDLLNQYETVTVSDLYQLLDVPGDFTDEKYGWTDLRGSGVSRGRGGYLLNLPKPELLD